MRVHKQPGTKGRLFEMMANVNKLSLNEADDASGLSYDASHPSNHPEVEYVTLEQTFDSLVDNFKGKNEMPTKWDVMRVVGRHDYEDWLQAGLLAWKVANDIPVEETDFRNVSDFVVKHVKEKYLGNVKEDYDYHGAEMDHLGQQDLAADQAEHPEDHNQTPPMDHPSQRDFDDKQQTGIKEAIDYSQFSDEELDQLYTKMFGHQGYHMSREGYIHALSGQGENPNGFVHPQALHLNTSPFKSDN